MLHELNFCMLWFPAIISCFSINTQSAAQDAQLSVKALEQKAAMVTCASLSYCTNCCLGFAEVFSFDFRHKRPRKKQMIVARA